MHVVGHERFGQGTVPGKDGLRDAAVRVDDLLPLTVCAEHLAVDLRQRDVPHRLREQGEDRVAARGDQRGMKTERERVIQLRVVRADEVNVHEVLHQRHSGAIGVRGGESRDRRFQHRLRVQEVAVPRAEEMEEQRLGLSQRRALRPDKHRTAPGPRLDGDEPLDLEDPQRLAQRAAADRIAVEHAGLARQHRATLESGDVPDDLTGDGHRNLVRTGRHAPAERRGRPFDGRAVRHRRDRSQRV